ncbi:precorrin-2 dehydrogenase/sirohydrochlorin ferrochelatase family protein [Candidatus Enterococcus clewellii]|uniref:precorrin-2 dehydrogenase n=1 Tax=Candidatus Enterococcus clewellii TaxID=1834193 RepID=A0A242K501_9ENTE|nr:bifunctional precorrin-2 dehydrogenase/sirohydrochlorin ferrochelatase [Enterococcus sp. 9E7_DIV0242]OTP14607.1 hypothetical protein A5888_002708 [Enterococcus sp. 9E7_DIV0242]
MYPIMLDLKDKTIVIIGGGRIALRKTKALLQAGGRVVVVAPMHDEEFESLENVALIKRPYRTGDCKEAHLIFACTDSKVINQQIVEEAEPWQWVNDCSKKENSDFFNMSIIQHETGVVAFSSNGQSPVETKKLKQEIEALLCEKELLHNKIE